MTRPPDTPPDPTVETDEVVARLRATLATLPDPVSFLAGLFAAAPFGLQIYRHDGHPLLVNPAFLELFGSQPPPEYNVLRDEIAARTGVLDLIRRAFAGETITVPPTWYDPRELEQVTVRTGRRVAIEGTFFPLHDDAGAVSHVAIVFKDVTAELRLREEAEAERDLLRAIVTQSGDGIIVCDERGAVKIFNQAAAQQFGRVETGLPPPTWQDGHGLARLDGTPLPLEETPLERALRGEHIVDAHWIVHRSDGTRRVLAGTATPLRRADGGPAGAVLTTRDVTERVAREEEQAREAVFRERFIGILGHDLRSPLASVRLSAEGLLRRSDLEPRSLRAIERIVGGARRMERLIHDLLDVTRSRLGGGIPVASRAADLHVVCRQAVDEAQATAPDRPVVLDLRGDGHAEFDPDRLAQVISNLVGNALAHAPSGEAVTVSVYGDEGEVCLRVHNGGPPIPADVLPYVFDPFRRGSVEPRGLGLGLYIVRQILLAHGGRIGVTSEAGEGTTFTACLPRRRPAP